MGQRSVTVWKCEPVKHDSAVRETTDHIVFSLQAVKNRYYGNPVLTSMEPKC